MFKKLVIAFLLFAVVFPFTLLAFYNSTSAHPIDEIDGVNVYDQKQIITVSPNKVDLRIGLTFYAFEKMKIWGSVNTNNDQELTQKEKDTWMKLGSEASYFEVNGKNYLFTPTSVSIPDYDEFFSSKPIEVSIDFTSKTRLSAGDTVKYYYKGKDKRLREITLDVKGEEGIKVTELIRESEDVATFTILEGPQGISASSGIASSDRLNQFLDKYVKVETLPMGLLLIAIGVSFLIGMLHALTPGHGKAIVAGYLVGEKGTVSHAVQLGLIITITHTASVFLLGLGTLFLTQYIVPSVVIYWVNLISGFLVAGFGLYLLVKRVRDFKSFRTSHNHSDLDEILETGKKAAHTHHDHSHDSHTHPTTHTHSDSDLELTWKNLLPLGISGGLVPCVDALAILIVAISLGKIALGLTLLVVFSLGLASALIIGGVIVVVAKNKAMKKFEKVEKFEKYSSIVSAVVVTLLGIAIILGKPL